MILLIINLIVISSQFPLQSVSISQNEDLKLSFDIITAYLPFPLRDVPSQFKTEISIQYSSGNNQLKQHQNDPSISLMISNSTANPKLPSLLKQIISATFSFAIQDRYVIYLNETKQFYYSSPNDKFCVHHIEQIVRNLLPCRNLAGIGMLLDTSSLFNAKRKIQMQVLWDKSGMKIDIVLSPIIVFSQTKKYIKQVKFPGIKRIKISDACSPYFQEIRISLFGRQLSAANTLILDIIESSHPLLNKNHQLIQQKYYYNAQKQIYGEWYYPYKKLSYSVKLNSIKFNSSISQIIIRQILPPSCQAQSLKLKYPQNSTHLSLIKQINSQICHQLSLQTLNQYNRYQHMSQQRYGHQYVNPNKCQVKINVSQINMMPIDFILQIPLKCYQIPFDQYQTIYGGGQQLQQIPISIIYDNDQTQFLNVSRATLRVPLPDQGIPFIVMTLSLIVLAYVYLAIWKNLSFRKRQIKANNKIKIQ